MRKARSSLTVAVMVAVLLGSVSATYPQTTAEDCRYFVETGHYVCGEFLEFYETRGELEVFGYPLTEAFDDPTHGLRVQYFQRARMEWYPDNPDPYRVQLGLLVDELGYHFPPVRPEQIPASNSAPTTTFPRPATSSPMPFSITSARREGWTSSAIPVPNSCTKVDTLSSTSNGYGWSGTLRSSPTHRCA